MKRYSLLYKHLFFLLTMLCSLLCGCASWQGPGQTVAGQPKALPPVFAPTLEGAQNNAPAPLLPQPDMPASGEAALSLSIERAVTQALTNNRDLAVQQLAPMKSGAFEEIEKAAFDPEVYAGIRYEKSADWITKNGTTDKQVVRGKTVETSMGLSRQFATGTTLAGDFDHEYAISGDPSGRQKAGLTLTFTQSLLQGFGPRANLVRVRQARLDRDISLSELKGYTEAVVAETETTYWRYVLARRKIDIYTQSLTIAKKQLMEVEQQIEVGLLPRTEAAAARSEMALQEQALINAESALEGERLKLLFLISPERAPGFDAAIQPTTLPDINTLPVTDLADRIALAQKARPDLAQARMLFENNRLETMATQNGLLPKLDFFISLGSIGYGTGFSDAMESLTRDNATEFSAGLSVTRTLGNRKADAQHLAATVSRRQAKLAVDNLARQVALDVRLAVNEVARTRRQIAASATTRKFAEETEKAEKGRFDVGDSTSLLVTRAQRDLLVARIAEVEAIVNYRVALIKLFIAEGSLLEMRGIALNP